MWNSLRLAGLAVLVMFAACADREAPPPSAAAESRTAPAQSGGVADYEAALAAPGRLAEDLEQDAGRKPAEVPAFFGVQPGAGVLDLYSGGGYFTELLAAVVGPSGTVVAHNNQAYLAGAADQLAARFADPRRLANVERLQAENNALELAPGRFDYATPHRSGSRQARLRGGGVRARCGERLVAQSRRRLREARVRSRGPWPDRPVHAAFP